MAQRTLPREVETRTFLERALAPFSDVRAGEGRIVLLLALDWHVAFANVERFRSLGVGGSRGRLMRGGRPTIPPVFAASVSAPAPPDRTASGANASGAAASRAAWGANGSVASASSVFSLRGAVYDGSVGHALRGRERGGVAGTGAARPLVELMPQHLRREAAALVSDLGRDAGLADAELGQVAVRVRRGDRDLAPAVDLQPGARGVDHPPGGVEADDPPGGARERTAAPRDDAQ